MKVMIVISTSGVGGSQRVAMHLAQWLENNSDHSCEIVALRPPLGEAYDMSGFKYEQINSNRVIHKLRSIIKDRKPDILLSMGVPLALYTVPACVGTKVKHIVSERNDPAHFAGKTTTKIISRLLMRTASGFVFQTKDAKDYYGGKIAKKSVVIPNPLFDMENMPDQPFDGDRKKTVVSVGRLNMQKNQTMLIETFAELSNEFADYTLTIWGEGPERANLEALINKLGMQNKIFLPGTSENVMEEIYDEGMFVLCSDFEGMPNALMEAMALGLPCISTDCPCGGPRDLIKDGENGKLVPVGNAELLTDAIKDLIKNSDYAKKIGDNAFLIRKTYNNDAICKQWLLFFESIIMDRIIDK